MGGFAKLRDDGIVAAVCPTCQNVFQDSLKASMPATAMLLCMGLFSIFQLEATRPANCFPVDDRSMAELIRTVRQSKTIPL